VVDEAVHLQDAVPHVDAFTLDPLFEQFHEKSSPRVL
jgi:hypothetical protein